eukprot:Nitzschia sp. Nitz4//scaffold193_size40683//29294//29800//NITZ4_007502-RA/size40683-processed-gene-0.21-mRNA-1//-1//CDS//3329540288//4060//frame0
MAPGEATGQRKRNPRRRANTAGGKSDDKIATRRGEHNVKSPPPGKKGKKGETTFFAKGTKKALPPTKGKGKKEAAKTKKDTNPKGKKDAAKKPKPEKKKPVTAEDLEREMDEYWQKSKDQTIVSKKLDEDMDSYWAKKGEAEATEAEEAKGETTASEETKEVTEEPKE